MGGYMILLDLLLILQAAYIIMPSSGTPETPVSIPQYKNGRWSWKYLSACGPPLHQVGKTVLDICVLMRLKILFVWKALSYTCSWKTYYKKWKAIILHFNFAWQKLYLLHWAKNPYWGCLRIGCWRQCLQLSGRINQVSDKAA